MSFLEQNWIALVSVIIALTGGIPGVIATVRHFTERPKLHCLLKNVISGATQSYGDTEAVLLWLTVTVTNERLAPLVPERFLLQVLIRGKWRPCRAAIIYDDDGDKFRNLNFEIRFNRSPKEQDLQQLTHTITRDVPAHGHLKFLLDNVPLHEIQILQKNSSFVNCLRLQCKDATNRTHEIPIIDQTTKPGIVTEYPKHGMRMRLLGQGTGSEPSKQT